MRSSPAYTIQSNEAKLILQNVDTKGGLNHEARIAGRTGLSMVDLRKGLRELQRAGHAVIDGPSVRVYHPDKAPLPRA